MPSRDVALASRREWLLADGLGGWAASTVLGLNTRGEHGLLVTAATPPYPRLVLLSRVEEAVTCDGVRYELGTNDYGGRLAPARVRARRCLRARPPAHPDLGGRGPPRLAHGRPPAPRARGRARLPAAKARSPPPSRSARCSPIASRDSASTRTRPCARDVTRVGPDLILQPYPGCPPLAMRMAGATWDTDAHWYRGFRYVHGRGETAGAEDLFSPGAVPVRAEAGVERRLHGLGGRHPPLDRSHGPRGRASAGASAASAMRTKASSPISAAPPTPSSCARPERAGPSSRRIRRG